MRCQGYEYAPINSTDVFVPCQIPAVIGHYCERHSALPEKQDAIRSLLLYAHAGVQGNPIRPIPSSALPVVEPAKRKPPKFNTAQDLPQYETPEAAMRANSGYVGVGNALPESPYSVFDNLPSGYTPDPEEVRTARMMYLERQAARRSDPPQDRAHIKPAGASTRREPKGPKPPKAKAGLGVVPAMEVTTSRPLQQRTRFSFLSEVSFAGQPPTPPKSPKDPHR